MRKRRAFVLNSTVILLLIPLMLLLATYEDVSSQIIISQSERIQIEKTYRVVSYVEMDFQRTLEISGKRAIVTIVDYIANTRDFLDPNNPDNMANATIRDLVLFGEANEIAKNYSDNLMKDQTIIGWLGNMSAELQKQGYDFKIANISVSQIRAMSPAERADFLRQNVELVVAPLDSFRIVIKAKMNDVTISDLAGKVVYTGPIPREGHVYSIITLENLEDPLFSALTYGRYYRSIEPCEYTFPELIDKPVKVLYGNGSSDTDHVLGKYSSVTWSEGFIFFGEYYPGDGATGYVLRTGDINQITAPVVVNTTLKGVPISPKLVFQDSDIGVLVFGNTGPSVHWCSLNYKWRVNITIPKFPDGSLVLLKLPTSIFPNIYHTDGEASMMIYEKSDTACVQVPFWIEYWGPTYVWVWIKASGTDYTIYFTDDPVYATDGYNKEYLFWLIDTFDGTSINPVLWNDLADAYLDGNGHLVVPGGTEKLALQTAEAIDGTFFVRFRMAPDSAVTDFDAGVQVAPSTDSSEGYLQVTVNYPSNVQDVQIPVYLDSTTAQMILHNDLSQAQIEVYSDPQMTSPLPFWIEYWNDNGALIWIRGDLPGTFYIRYNTGTYKRGNGDEVFEFFDDFNKTLSKWAIDPYSQGATAILNPAGEGTVTIEGGDSIFAMRTNTRLDVDYSFAIRFRMRPNFNEAQDWNAGIGIWDEDRRYYSTSRGIVYYLEEQLFTDDIIGNGNPLAIHWAEWGYTRKSVWLENWWVNNDNLDNTGLQDRDFNYHTYEIQMTFGTSVKFLDLTRKIVNNYDRTPITINSPLEYIYFVIDSGDKNRGAVFDWIFVRKLIDDTQLSYQITKGASSTRIQFIDDNPFYKNEDHGGDTLAILENWGDSLISGSASVLSDYHRYQVVFRPGTTNIELSFEDIDSTARSVSYTLDKQVSSPVKVGIVIDSQGSILNTAYFDWIVIGRMPYYTVDPIDVGSSGIESAPETKGAYDARAYDLQPLISCIIGQKYFGTYEGVSFFERLENSVTNHDRYFQLAKKMQDELGIKYGDEYYPIGLVSFMVPNTNYDQKLFDLFSSLGILVEDGQSSVDYYFLNYYFGRIAKKTGYRVWGISYGTSALTGDLSVVPFFIDDETAAAILGPTGAQDLLKR
ncbi:Hypothetical protein TON_1896 [Thermococcus onnurineus NA1]|uniref:DUF2341 domain-containing protein n=1 Tax=Thermococcus onnurineus (strain NA1) TaxID=523850 RepID=B6YVR3_THEON|nr:DUF2341 domain-containing protein [Thermococcus onnurineus]ACJ17387.1 Hypothetical protein TON_1896 [Thermococcus onnurineus NA1]